MNGLQRVAAREFLQACRTMLGPARRTAVRLGYDGRQIHIYQAVLKPPHMRVSKTSIFWHCAALIDERGGITYGSSKGAVSSVLRAMAGPEIRVEASWNPYAIARLPRTKDSCGQKPTYSDARFMDHLGEDDS